MIVNAEVTFGYEHKDGNYYPHLGIFSAVNSWSSYTLIAEVPIHEGTDPIVLDVSSYSGEYYIGLYGYALTASVSRIYLYRKAYVIIGGTTIPTAQEGENGEVYLQYDGNDAITNAYVKVNGAWQNLIGTSIDDVGGVFPSMGIPIIERNDWDALTTAQKKSYGLTIIQDSTTGYMRGDYVNGEDYELTGVHIWTKSTGGFDAAMYVQNGYWDTSTNQFVTTGEAVSVIYTSVQSQNTYDCNGVATLGYPSDWRVYATDAVTDGTNTYAIGDLVKTWSYSAEVDFYIYKSLN